MVIKFESVSHTYHRGAPMEQTALKNINLEITENQFLAIVGHTGSGKSTLIQHMNALLKPTDGTVTIAGKTIKANEKAKKLKAIRQKVGLVFQFPEYQLFEETVEKDLMFGPMNYGVSKENAKEKAREVIKIVGLTEDILQHSPFNLSGGQKRRVAIAGILAMEPDVLILDEPTAGLDPSGQKEMMQIFRDLHENHHKTIILVTHDMDLVGEYAKQMIVMHQGEIKLKGTPREVFKEVQTLTECGITRPTATRNYERLATKFELPPETMPLTVTEFIDQVAAMIKRS